MLDGNNCCHSVTDICTCEVRILVFKNTNLSRISIHDCSKCSLKSGQMSTALCIVNVITEAQYILTKFIGKLECHLYLNAVCFPFQVNRIMQDFRAVVQIFDKSNDTIRLMIGNILDLCTSFILKANSQFRIQICSLMKSALYFCCRKSCLFKNLRVREEIDTCSGLSGLTQLRQQPFLKFNGRDSPFIVIMMHISVTTDLNVQICRQGIHNRRTYSMKSSAGLIGRIIKFTACMKSCKYKSLCRYSFLMHIYRDSSSVVCYCTGTIFLQNYMDQTAVSCQMFIYCVIYDLINEMI